MSVFPVSADVAAAGWAMHVSRSTGNRYFYNVRSQRSLWFDATLPAGWAWGRDSENSPLFYEHLASGVRRSEKPALAAPAPTSAVALRRPALEGDDGADGPPPSKRMHREGVQDAGAACSAGFTAAPPTAVAAGPTAFPAVSSAPAPLLKPAGARTGPPARLPPLRETEFSIEDFPADKPLLPPDVATAAAPGTDGSFFSEEHQRVLSQVLAPIQKEIAQRAAWRASLRARRGMAGSGSGSGSGEGEGEGESGSSSGSGDAAAGGSGAGADGGGGGDGGEAADGDGDGDGDGNGDGDDDAIPVTIVDIGAGDGAATAFFLRELPSCTVYAIDLWRPGYYADMLREFGNDSAAAAYAARYSPSAAAPAPASGTGAGAGAGAAAGGAGGSAVDFPLDGAPDRASAVAFARFRQTVWEDQERVVPLRYPDLLGMRRLHDLGVGPGLIYIDGDLHVERLAPLLKEAARLFPSAIIAGGGWDLSTDVRSAVQDAAREQGRRLHVERGRAWTLAGELVSSSANTAADAAAALSDEQRAQVVEDERVKRESAQQAWLQGVIEVIARGDDIDALRVAVGRHGRPRSASAAPAAGVGSAGGAAAGGAGAPSAASCGATAAAGAAGAAGGEDGPDAWIDVGDSTNKHQTALMHAAHSGRIRIVRSLLLEHGASPNVQAARSMYTALGVAAYAGQEGVVRALLECGADPLLMNRYGETPLANAENRRHHGVAALLRPLTERAKEAVARLTPPSPLSVVTLKNGRPMTLRRVARPDQKLVERLYALCQEEFMTDEVKRRIRSRWVDRVLATDLADVDSRYSAVPRAGFWVAYVSAADFAAMAGKPAAGELTASDGTVIIGCAGLKPVPDPRNKRNTAAAAGASGAQPGALATIADSDTGELVRMCVHPEIRRAGVAAAIMRYVEMWARTADFARVKLTTDATMGAAQRLYASCGFVEVSPPGGVHKTFHGDLLTLIEFEKELLAESATTATVGAAGPA